MPNYRDYKVFGQGGFFHVFNRGVAKGDIFLGEEYYNLFLFRLKEQVLSKPAPIVNTKLYRRKVFEPNCFRIHAYCLMPNHFHFLIEQLANIPISELFQRVITGYSKVFNFKNNRVGSLFQDQYKAVRVESDEQLLWLSGYIHNNPIVAGLVDKLEDWKWSSYPEYIGIRKGTLVNTQLVLGLPSVGNDITRYKEFVVNSGEHIKTRKDLELLLLD